MKKTRDLTGSVFKNWTVLRFSHWNTNGKHRRAYWWCQCVCGEKQPVQTGNLHSGRAVGCGCHNRKADVANVSHTREYARWNMMMHRCYNPNNKSYKYYGARGVVVCDEWRRSYRQFWNDMGNVPSPEMSIERRDTNGTYCPGNCYWGTPLEQGRNRRNVRVYQSWGA